MPKFQQLSGCHEDAEQALPLGAFEFKRCPRTLVEERELRVLGLVGDGYLESLPPRERRRLPAKLVSALSYMVGLATGADP